MKRLILALSLVVLPMVAVDSAFADIKERLQQRQRDRSRNSQTQAVAENPYPEATRKDPEIRTNERSMRRIQSGYDKLNNGDHDKALATLKELEGDARLTSYEQAIVYQGLGQIAYEQDDLDTALRYWQKAVDADGLPNRNHFQLMYQIAQAQLMEEQYEQALVTIDRWLNETRAGKPEAYALKGNALYRLERYDEAIAVLDQAIAAGGDQVPDNYFELKMAALYEKNDYAGAARVLEELVRRKPNEVRYQINLAQAFIEMENMDRALAVMQDLRSSGRLQDPAHWRQLYQLQAYAGRHADAARTITDGIAAGALAEDKDVLRALGDNYYMAEMIDQAIDAYTRAAAQSPDDGTADQNRAHLLIEKERYAEAREALQTAFRKGNLKDPGTAYLLLGQLEAETENRQAAITAFREALKYERSRNNAELWLKNLGAR